MAIVIAGIDLAKHLFAVHGVDPAGKAALLLPEVRPATGWPDRTQVCHLLLPCDLRQRADLQGNLTSRFSGGA